VTPFQGRVDDFIEKSDLILDRFDDAQNKVNMVVLDPLGALDKKCPREAVR
jgi:hypothetical protein